MQSCAYQRKICNSRTLREIQLLRISTGDQESGFVLQSDNVRRRRIPNRVNNLCRIFNLPFKYEAQTALFDPLKAELNPIRHLLALVGAHYIVHVSRVRVKDPVRTAQ